MEPCFEILLTTLRGTVGAEEGQGEAIMKMVTQCAILRDRFDAL